MYRRSGCRRPLEWCVPLTEHGVWARPPAAAAVGCLGEELVAAPALTARHWLPRLAVPPPRDFVRRPASCRAGLGIRGGTGRQAGVVWC